MNICTTMKIIEKYGNCQKCGDETVGNGSTFNVEDKTFLRTCRDCGWKVEGYVTDDGEIVETFNNANQLGG